MLAKNKLYFVPLGGSGEIGMNLNTFGLNDQWIIVDIGITFGRNLGVDVIVPDPAFLADKNLLGIVLTHGHEDHIGAIPHLWPQLRCPIYATPFTAALVRRKLADAGLDPKVVQEINLNSTLNLGPFACHYVTLTHSILEPNGLIIETSQGNIFHTGDWKIDDAPLIGETTHSDVLESWGKKGILTLIGDSTNALEKGFSGSEETARTALIDLVKEQKQLVAISCFASNIARVESALIAAEKSGRTPVLMGRSMIKNYESARQCGYLADTIAPQPEEMLATLAPHKTLIICTGSQGETRAALSRMAFGQHPFGKISSGDSVIFSSRVIPGNEHEIAKIHNQLVRRGAKVITPKEYPKIHVSGHPCRDELKQMYSWVKPRFAIPVHGELRHMDAHADLARSLGVEGAYVPENGDIIHLSQDGPICVGKVTTEAKAVDGSLLVPLSDVTFKDRARLMDAGVCSVSITVSSRLDVLEIAMTLYGVHDQDRFFEDLENAVELGISQVRKKKLSQEALEEHVRVLLRKELYRLTGKKSVVIVHVMEGS